MHICYHSSICWQNKKNLSHKMNSSVVLSDFPPSMDLYLDESLGEIKLFILILYMPFLPEL